MNRELKLVGLLLWMTNSLPHPLSGQGRIDCKYVQHLDVLMTVDLADVPGINDVALKNFLSDLLFHLLGESAHRSTHWDRETDFRLTFTTIRSVYEHIKKYGRDYNFMSKFFTRRFEAMKMAPDNDPIVEDVFIYIGGIRSLLKPDDFDALWLIVKRLKNILSGMTKFMILFNQEDSEAHIKQVKTLISPLFTEVFTVNAKKLYARRYLANTSLIAEAMCHKLTHCQFTKFTGPCLVINGSCQQEISIDVVRYGRICPDVTFWMKGCPMDIECPLIRRPDPTEASTLPSRPSESSKIEKTSAEAIVVLAFLAGLLFLVLLIVLFGYWLLWRMKKGRGGRKLGRAVRQKRLCGTSAVDKDTVEKVGKKISPSKSHENKSTGDRAVKNGAATGRILGSKSKLTTRTMTQHGSQKSAATDMVDAEEVVEGVHKKASIGPGPKNN